MPCCKKKCSSYCCPPPQNNCCNKFVIDSNKTYTITTTYWKGVPNGAGIIENKKRILKYKSHTQLDQIIRVILVPTDSTNEISNITLWFNQKSNTGSIDFDIDRTKAGFDKWQATSSLTLDLNTGELNGNYIKHATTLGKAIQHLDDGESGLLNFKINN